MKTRIFFILGLVVSALPMAGQGITGRLDSLYTAIAKEDRLNGNVLVAEKGNILYERSFGFADFGEKVANTSTTAFELASLSKVFTSISILQLAEKGKLQLADSYGRYFPAFPYGTITIEQLLSHSSGLSDHDLSGAISAFEKRTGRRHRNGDLVSLLAEAHVSLKLAPGQKWWYCNLGYELLASLVEKLSGVPFAVYVQKHILQPAGMERTYLRLSSNDDRSYQAHNYDFPKRYAPERQRVDSTADDYSEGAFGHSGMVSTTGDLLKLVHALSGGRLIRHASLVRAVTGTRLSDGRPNDVWMNIGGMGETIDGPGWFIFKDEARGKTIFHAGGKLGAVTILLYNLEKDQVVIILDNAGSEGIYKNAQNALHILNGDPVEPARRNLARIYVRQLMSKGADAAASLLLSLSEDTSGYILRENDLNNLGYALLEDTFRVQALECFKLNCLLFPKSDNTFNSYGEALERCGYPAEAVRMYRRSLELSPDNEDSRKALRRMEGKGQ